MSYDEDEEVRGGFRVTDGDDDEPMEMPPEDLDFGLDEEDPDRDS
ncbi:MAG: hypothetical protein UT98_C0001G0134 [Candidatus Nomurabacteria bacterium GW2011_GWF2_40_31]|uniref:Uncharacterized protein n=2 Tax=Candidatus Nomuraibacteriota TaxID=1752729 RepID=A0A837HU63_9BACT|nr:MAG: hypothetical protein UT27_C0001G0034 [Candidatus Nomurabacteria bacterium GW2011_GWD2_39_12]KKR20699.1 MAG: hypothetical protein UT51_C0002G0134 [Candidatus Nomurabacteria bacterium GW2011_GWC2_39_41]KKR37373.1 MAG: hypothetical protein UT70_C0001G0049 [Candidatus Nomurabacteria bacterium GW2011_GWE2_40_10]KKR38620.1 MAG: hypothetical protein UT73_C0002G0105 [Candidatus Nomurabacteria bacterium GW2011_GWB1_40_11]KKR40345.1 MAG: hypothetical protein UT74_C0001G0079 [Parcubacteria group b